MVKKRNFHYYPESETLGFHIVHDLLKISAVKVTKFDNFKSLGKKKKKYANTDKNMARCKDDKS
jgi:hypothetical protein